MNNIFLENIPSSIFDFIRNNDPIFKHMCLSPKVYTDQAIEFNNKISIIWLVYISTFENKHLFNKSFNDIINNIDDLYLFVNICRKSIIRNGLGRSIKRTVNTWLHNNISNVDLLENKQHIIEILKLTHPLFRTDASFQKIIQKLIS